MYLGAGNTLRLLDNSPIHWPGGNIPVDLPECGFTGDEPTCIPEPGDVILVLLLIYILYRL